MLKIITTLARLAGNYEVTDVVLEHNHVLHLPKIRHLIASQGIFFLNFKLLKYKTLMVLELGQKLHMSWLVDKLVDDSILAIPSVIRRTICGPSANEK